MASAVPIAAGIGKRANEVSSRVSSAKTVAPGVAPLSFLQSWTARLEVMPFHNPTGDGNCFRSDSAHFVCAYLDQRLMVRTVSLRFQNIFVAPTEKGQRRRTGVSDPLERERPISALIPYVQEIRIGGGGDVASCLAGCAVEG